MVLLIFVALALIIMLGSILFDLVVYVVPAGLGFMAATIAYHHGSGVIGAVGVAILVGGAIWASAQSVFAMSRSPRLRFGLAAAFAAPAGYAGFIIIHGLFQNSSVAPGWVIAWSLLAGLAVAIVSFNRFVTVPPPPGRDAWDGPRSEPDALPTLPPLPPRLPRRSSREGRTLETRRLT